MKHVLVLFVLISLLCQTTRAQECENGLYLFKDGSSWEIANFDKKGKPTGYTAFKFSNVTTLDNGFNGELHSESFDEKNKQLAITDVNLKCINGDITVDMKSIISERQLESYKKSEVKIVKDDALLFPKTLEVGQKLPDGTLVANLETDGSKVATLMYEATERTVLAKESITVPAGTFECYKISTKIHSVTTVAGINVNYDYVLVEWFAYGVGVVRSELYKKGNLETYSVLSKLAK